MAVVLHRMQMEKDLSLRSAKRSLKSRAHFIDNYVRVTGKFTLREKSVEAYHSHYGSINYWL